jgi:putative phosphoribosyl transferase
MKHSLLKEQKQYYPQQNDLSLKHKTVLLIDDILDTPDSLQACLNEIKKQQPLKIIIAVAVASEESARSVGAEVDEFIYLRLETHVASGKTYFKQYPSIGNKAVKKMLDEFTNKSLLH